MKKPETEKVLIIIEEFLAEIRRRLEGHPPRVRHKQDWGRGFILLLPQSAVLPGSDAGSHGAKQHRVLSSKTVRPLAPYSAVLGMLLRLGLRFVQWRLACNSVISEIIKC